MGASNAVKGKPGLTGRRANSTTWGNGRLLLVFCARNTACSLSRLDICEQKLWINMVKVRICGPSNSFRSGAAHLTAGASRNTRGSCAVGGPSRYVQPKPRQAISRVYRRYQNLRALRGHIGMPVRSSLKLAQFWPEHLVSRPVCFQYPHPRGLN